MCVLLIMGSLAVLGMSRLTTRTAAAYALEGTPKASPLNTTGSGFTYQGRLTESGGPASGQYDLQFLLFDALLAGNQVAIPLTVFGQTVTDGLFTVKLDFG